MGHPFGEHRAHKVEKSRVGRMCGGYASGGAVKGEHGLVKKVLASHEAQHEALKSEGKGSKRRGDRVKRARGGHVKGKGHKTNVNVIVAPKSDGAPPPMAGLGPKPPMPAMAPPPAGPPPMAAKPPMMPPPSGAPGGPPGMPPMPMRKKGGRIAHDTAEPVRKHKGGIEAHGKLHDPGGTTSSIPGPTTNQALTKRMASKNAVREVKAFGKSQVGRAKGGKVDADKKGLTGVGDRTPVQHSGNKDDTQNIGRKKPFSYAKGGKIRHRDDGGSVDKPSPPQTTASGSPQTTASGSTVAAGMRRNPNAGISADGKVHGFATGGPIYADGKEGKGMGPALHEGSRSGLGRLAKAHRAPKINHV